MTLVPQNTRFIGFSEIANLAERKTDYLNSISQPFTMQDITDSVGGFSKNGAIINTVTDVFSTTFENNITVDPNLLNAYNKIQCPNVCQNIVAAINVKFPILFGTDVLDITNNSSKNSSTLADGICVI